MVVLVADLVVLEVVVATMAVMAVHLARALAGAAAAAAEVAIRIQHFVALLFILKELKRLVLVLLYMEV
jgi:hypothetical protein